MVLHNVGVLAFREHANLFPHVFECLRVVDGDDFNGHHLVALQLLRLEHGAIGALREVSAHRQRVLRNLSKAFLQFIDRRRVLL